MFWGKPLSGTERDLPQNIFRFRACAPQSTAVLPPSSLESIGAGTLLRKVDSLQVAARERSPTSQHNPLMKGV